MSEKRFSATLSQEEIDIMPYVVSENDGEVFYKLDGVVDLLNEQQATISALKEENASLKQRIRDVTYNNCGDINAKKKRR